jgi:diguanylate cyclase (GGDEF)-like protein
MPVPEIRRHDLQFALRSQALIEIDAALAGRGYSLRFIPKLEATYEAACGPARNRAIGRYLIVYLAAKLLFLFANLRVGSQVFRVSMELRLGVVLPLTLLAVYLLNRPLPSWVHGVAAFTPLMAETALVMLLGRLSGSAAMERYVIAAGVGIFAQTLLMQVPFRYCVRGLVVALSVFCALCVVRWPGHFGPPVSLDEIIFVVVFAMPALYERYSRERSTRREFLLSESNRLHTEDILRMNAHLERLSSLDGLTGIFNRRYLDVALSRLCKIAVENKRWISVLMIDIDHFKAINDTAGHQHGDFCLEQVAQILQQSIRAGVDTVARYGGEEFVAILPDANEQDAMVIAERIRETVEAAGLPATYGAVVTISVGVAVLRGVAGSTFTADQLVAAADDALYEAKRSGRNRIVCSVCTVSVA